MAALTHTWGWAGMAVQRLALALAKSPQIAHFRISVPEPGVITPGQPRSGTGLEKSTPVFCMLLWLLLQCSRVNRGESAKPAARRGPAQNV